MNLSTEEIKPLIKAIDVLLKAEDDDLKERLKEAGYINVDDTVDAINGLEDELSEALEKELNGFVEGIENIELDDSISNIIELLLNNDTTAENLENAFKSSFEDIMTKLTDVYIKDIDKDLAFTIFSNRTTDWINSWSEELGELMKLTSHNNLNRIVNNAFENGDSIQKVVENLMDSYGFSRARARATAITEILTAHSYSKEEAIRQSPAVDRKEWVHTGTHKNTPRPHHQTNPPNGQIVDKSESFEINSPKGTYKAKFPRDTNLPAGERVYCHCVHRGIVNDDIMSLSLEERRALQQQAIDEDNGEWEKELDAKNRAKAGIE